MPVSIIVGIDIFFCLYIILFFYTKNFHTSSTHYIAWGCSQKSREGGDDETSRRAQSAQENFIPEAMPINHTRKLCPACDQVVPR